MGRQCKSNSLHVVLGHFFQSMTKAGILPTNDLYQWFNETIYYFHVPLFFICSGYLYQKLSRVDDIHSWSKNALKKAINHHADLCDAHLVCSSA